MPGKKKRRIRTRAPRKDEVKPTFPLSAFGPEDELEFEWSARKANENFQKHGVAFENAKTVFGDRLAGVHYDEKHSNSEVRYVTIGEAVGGELLVVSHTVEGAKVRIISARTSTKGERRRYEEGRE